MCIALPMKVLESGPMMVVCERNGRRLEVDCSMIDQPAVGAKLRKQRPAKLKPLSAQRLASWRVMLTKRQSARGLAI